MKKILEENKCCQLTSALVYGKVYFTFRRNVGIQTWRGGRAVEGTGLENRRSASFRGFESHPLRHAQSKKKSVSSNPFDLQKYPRGRRGSPAKGVGRETGARVQIPPSAPQETALFVGNRAVFFFYYVAFALEKFLFIVPVFSFTPKFTPNRIFYPTRRQGLVFFYTFGSLRIHNSFAF